MADPAPIINFAATRRAIVQAIAAATNLPTNRIIKERGAGPVQPPPPRPYCSFQYRIIGMRAGQDWVTPAPDAGATMYEYAGERGLSVDFTFHADNTDDAYSLALEWQFGLSEEPIRDILEAGGLSVYVVGDARDLTTLINTGFEARAFVEAEMWVSVSRLVDLGSIDAVALNGKIFDVDDTLKLTISTTVEAKG